MLQLFCAIALSMLGGCRQVPQVLTDEAVFKELDALYTAVTTKKPKLVEDCRERLTKLHSEGRLSDPGFKAISEIIGETEKDQWGDAAQHLYDFMRAQRKTKSST